MTMTLPQGFTIRPAHSADLEAMYELGRQYQLAVYGEVDLTLQDLRTFCQAPTFTLAEQTRLVFDRGGRLVYAVYFEHQAYIRYSLIVDALPGHENAGVRAYLMALGEAWARREMVRAPAQACTFLRIWVATRDRAVTTWFEEQREFAEVRRFWEMQIALPAAPAIARWPQGVQLRPFDPGRASRAVFEADEEMFRDHWGHLPQDYPTWRHWTVERADFDPTLWFVAYAGEQIVGLSLCRDGARGWVDTLGVARAWRGQGLGLALLVHSFGAFFQRGRQRVGLGVDAQSLTGAPRLYERAGMHIAQENVIYEKVLRPGIDLSVRTLVGAGSAESESMGEMR
ncbi:MAG TPA: GNAT family N-acetyltransferase [Ktedonobacteraceae bacterium]|jgi:ribosomal protein S18 acetylase RimI-like enzyme